MRRPDCLAKMAAVLGITGLVLITVAVAVVMAEHMCRQGPREAGEQGRGRKYCRKQTELWEREKRCSSEKSLGLSCLPRWVGGMVVGKGINGCVHLSGPRRPPPHPHPPHLFSSDLVQCQHLS